MAWSWNDIPKAKASALRADGKLALAVELDEASFDRLDAMAAEAGCGPAETAARLLADLLADDAAEEGA